MQLVIAVALLLTIAALDFDDGKHNEDPAAARLLVCNAPAPLEDVSIELEGCSVVP